jgi:hypothetical protein
MTSPKLGDHLKQPHSHNGLIARGPVLTYVINEARSRKSNLFRRGNIKV